MKQPTQIRTTTKNSFTPLQLQQQQHHTGHTDPTDQHQHSQSFQSSSRNYGNTIPLFINPVTKQPKFILGPHYFVFIPTWICSLGGCIYFAQSFIKNAYLPFALLSILSCLFFLYSYMKVGLSLPGLASTSIQPNQQSKQSERYCRPCLIIRPRGTKHCYYCDVCIYQIDHHCPWVGKCIGRDNLCAFYVFLGSIGVMMAMLLITALTMSNQK